MTNFDIFLQDPQFTAFAEPAVAAEKVYQIDPGLCVLSCRRAMEAAVKWMYSVDAELVPPWDQTLVVLLGTEEFRDIVGVDLWRRLDLIRRKGNDAAHGGRAITPEIAALCLENLYVFFDFLACCYGTAYEERAFDRTTLSVTSVSTGDSSPKWGAKEPVAASEEEQKLASPCGGGGSAAGGADGEGIDLAALMAENAALKAELTARREAQQANYVPKPLDISEYKTRKIYIDAMLLDAGWVEGKNWLNEYEIPGMPNKSEVGYAD